MFSASQALSLFRNFLIRVDCDNKKSSDKREHYLLKEEFPMCVARLAAERSKDPARQIGACIVDDENRVLAYGYNGHPSGDDFFFPWKKDEKFPFVCHAERNAIYFKTSVDVRGATLFTTLYPCNECAKSIVQSGIKKVVYYDYDLSEKFKPQESKMILEKGLPEKPVQYFDYLERELGTKNIERGYKMPNLITPYADWKETLKNKKFPYDVYKN